MRNPESFSWLALVALFGAPAGHALAQSTPAADPPAQPSTPDATPSAETQDSLAPADEPALVADRPLDNDRNRFRLGKGLSFESADGQFVMIPRLRAQFRHTTVNPEGGPAKQGMQIRRARLQFGGRMWSEHLAYKAEFAVSPRDVATRDTPGTSILLDWYIQVKHLRDANLRIGQYKVPFNRQRVVSSGDLQLVDRAIVNARFNVDRDLGLDLRSSDFLGLDALKYYLGVFVGEGRNTFRESDFGLMYLGRIEVLPLGTDFKDYKEADLEYLPAPRISIGLGAGYIDRAKRDRGILGREPADGGTTQVSLLNADLVFKWAGLSVFSEYILRDGRRDYGEQPDPQSGEVMRDAALSGHGATLQVGYLLPRTRFELAGRLSRIEPLGDDSPMPTENEAGLGANYYFAHHALKLQADYFRLTAGESVEHEVRVQLQAAY